MNPMTENAGTTATAPEAQTTEGTTAPATGTPTLPDEVTTLRSRNAGLDAKVTSLSQTVKDALARAEAAEARALALAEAKENGDQELRAQLERERAERLKATIEAKTEKIARKYPESYAVLGEAVANLSEDQLAANEARLVGVPVDSHTPPTPVGNNAARPQAPANKSIEEMTLAELKEYQKTAFVGLTWDALSQGD